MMGGLGLGLGLRLGTGIIAPATPATLTLPTDTADGTSGMTGTVTTNRSSGTLYWFISTSATPPTAANLKAAVGAAAAGSQAVTASGVQNIVDTGLTASTTYYTHYLHNNTAGDSNIATADGFTTAAAPTDAPVLTQTSTAGQNPLDWSGSYANWTTGVDYLGCRWRINGGAWTNETERLIDSDLSLQMLEGSASFAWPLFDAQTFTSGQLIEVQEWINRSGVIAYSNTLSDTMAGAVAFTLGTTNGGVIEQAASVTSHSGGNFNNLAFSAGRALVFLTSYSTAGGSTDSGPTSMTLTPSAGGTAITMSKVFEAARAGSRAIECWISDSNVSAIAYNLAITRPAAAEANAFAWGTLVGANPVATDTQGSFTNGGTATHTTPSVTVPINGLALGCYMIEDDGTPDNVTVGSPAIELAEIVSIPSFSVGLCLAQRTTTGTFSFTHKVGGPARFAIAWGPA